MKTNLFYAMIDAAIYSGLTVDALEFMARGLDENAVAILLGNVSNLPVYMKSREIPYRSCIFSAPSIEILKSPLSHCE